MPAYTNLRTFINALKTGKSHICECLDAFFADLDAASGNDNWADFIDANQNWSTTEPPAWLEGFLLSIGMTADEARHVVNWPKQELQKTREAAQAAVNSNQSPTFFWGLYDGDVPLADPRTDPDGNPQVLFQSPGASLRLTLINYGEIYVEEL